MLPKEDFQSPQLTNTTQKWCDSCTTLITVRMMNTKLLNMTLKEDLENKGEDYLVVGLS